MKADALRIPQPVTKDPKHKSVGSDSVRTASCLDVPFEGEDFSDMFEEASDQTLTSQLAGGPNKFAAFMLDLEATDCPDFPAFERNPSAGHHQR